MSVQRGNAILARLLVIIAIGLPSAYAQAADKGLLWVGCGVVKEAFMPELAKAYEAKTGIRIRLQGGGDTKGIRDTALGKSDLGGACRVNLKGHPLEMKVTEIPIAWDALVVITNKANPVKNLSLYQLREIYLGRIRNWKQLGGPNAGIELYVRRGKLSGVGRDLRQLVFADYNQEFTKRARVVASTGPLERAVETHRYAMGTTGVSSARHRKVNILDLEGKKPSYDNIKNGRYTLYRPLYLVVNKQNDDPRVKDFIRFVQSSAGRRVIRKAGSVPYIDATDLVMKQLKQLQRADNAGL